MKTDNGESLVGQELNLMNYQSTADVILVVPQWTLEKEVLYSGFSHKRNRPGV